MPIYEFACPRCRKIFSFLSKKINPDRAPACPQCGSKKLRKEVSGFAMLSGGRSDPASSESPGEPNFDDPKIMRAMNEMERDLSRLDENNPKHMAHLMRKMKDLMPPEATSKEMEEAIRRLEAGEDPDKIEEDMGEALGNVPDGDDGSASANAPYGRDPGLYDY